MELASRRSRPCSSAPPCPCVACLQATTSTRPLMYPGKWWCRPCTAWAASPTRARTGGYGCRASPRTRRRRLSLSRCHASRRCRASLLSRCRPSRPRLRWTRVRRCVWSAMSRDPRQSRPLQSMPSTPPRESPRRYRRPRSLAPVVIHTKERLCVQTPSCPSSASSAARASARATSRARPTGNRSSSARRAQWWCWTPPLARSVS